MQQSAEQTCMDKSRLALDSLAQLARQFSKKPDLNNLFEVMLLTLSGQMAVANLFVLLDWPGAENEGRFYSATNLYQGSLSLNSLSLSSKCRKYFLNHPLPQTVGSLSPEHCEPSQIETLENEKVEQVVPLIHEERVIGLIGLGRRVNDLSFDDDDLEMLSTMVNAVTPFIANSYYFIEVARLNTWYLDILDSVKQGVFVFDSDLCLKKANDSGFRILNMFMPEFDDKDALDDLSLHLVFPVFIFSGWAEKMQAVLNRSDGGLLENMVAKKDDRESIFNIRISRLDKNSKEQPDIIITLDDITNQKENEQRMFELEKFADKGQMASSIAHELNNFLAMILGGVELSQINIKNGKYEKVSNALEKLKESVLKMKRYTHGLMDYGRLNTQKEISSLNEVIEDVMSFVHVQKRFKRINIKTELDPLLPLLEMDNDQMAQLLLNFMNNAADAIFEVNKNDGKIWVKTFTRRNEVILSIADNGGGMTPEVKNKLFKMHLTTKEKGHGYGLVTCARIIENHQGRIDINSELGRGTVFTISFPGNPKKEA